MVGFAELEGDGHLDTFYVRGDTVSRGVGQQLYRAVERETIGLDIKRIFTEASITARPYFEKQGFCVVREPTVLRREVTLRNFAMEKLLSPSDREGEEGTL